VRVGSRGSGFRIRSPGLTLGFRVSGSGVTQSPLAHGDSQGLEFWFGGLGVG
jgi:hypothetical protein